MVYAILGIVLITLIFVQVFLISLVLIRYLIIA